MRALTNYRQPIGVIATAWPPAPALSRALDPAHWRSRAAHGHSWNAGASRTGARPTGRKSS
jgi:hypothetical protein